MKLSEDNRLENPKDHFFKEKREKKLLNHRNIWFLHDHFGENKFRGRRQLSADISLPNDATFVCLSTYLSHEGDGRRIGGGKHHRA